MAHLFSDPRQAIIIYLLVVYGLVLGGAPRVRGIGLQAIIIIYLFIICIWAPRVRGIGRQVIIIIYSFTTSARHRSSSRPDAKKLPSAARHAPACASFGLTQTYVDLSDLPRLM